MIVPSQILPFEKIEPGSWYIDLIGQTGAGQGYMFGTLSQAILGLGRVELVLRGMALAASLALFHPWYVRRAVRFWPTVFYVFVSVWIYYTFRATTFSVLHIVVYRCMPVLIIANVLGIVLAHRARRRLAIRAAPSCES